MSPYIPAPKRITLARETIQKARDLPVPAHAGKSDFSYIAQVKAYMQDAKDLVKFIPRTPSATAELKQQVQEIFEEAEKTERELLR